MMGVPDHGPEDLPVSIVQTVGPRVGAHELFLLLVGVLKPRQGHHSRILHFPVGDGLGLFVSELGAPMDPGDSGRRVPSPT